MDINCAIESPGTACPHPILCYSGLAILLQIHKHGFRQDLKMGKGAHRKDDPKVNGEIAFIEIR